jgi:hypothetical protein
MKQYRIIKGKKIHVNQLASMSRKFTVNNNTIPQLGGNGKNYVHIWREIRTSRFDTPVYGNTYEVDKDGHYHLIEHDSFWTPVEYPQPKRLIKKKAHKGKEKRNDFVKFFPNYPYTLPKMNKIQYCEKLVEHKLAKWERKNPKPMDMFTEDVEKWKQTYENMRERFRDFVVSIYDPLSLTGRFVVAKENTATYQEEQVAKIKDVNGEGHRVNELPKDSKLMKKAQKITNETKAKRPNLVATNLKDHKRKKGRIILPEAA